MAAPSFASSSRAKRVLVVEDESIIALDLQRGLGALGYDVVAVAATAEDAIARASTLHPDVVLMDIQLRGPSDGVEAADEIRRRLGVPVIFLTAYADPATLARARITGPFGYLLKPFEERELHIVIEMALERHAMERKLRESESWLAATLGSIGDGVIATDDTGRIRFMNKVAEAVTGWHAGAGIGLELGEVLRLARPLEGVCQDLEAGKTAEGVLLSRDGCEVLVEGSSTPIRDTTGAILGSVLALRDVRERRRVEMEREKLVAELARSNAELDRLATDLATRARDLGRTNADLEQFAYVASHDLQEPLRTVVSYLQLLERQYRAKLDERGQEFLGYAVEGGKRMSALINDLLDFSRVGRQAHALETTDADAALSGALANLENVIAESRAVVTHERLPVVTADAGLLVQLFQNLIGNAIKFRGTATPRIDIRVKEEPGELVFAVQDNGIGIEPEYFERIFVIFQRLHGREDYPGTGIGLALCKRIVQHHGGRIWVESTPGRGATFFFTLGGLPGAPA
jgi:PAS domain S-box-containing protein